MSQNNKPSKIKEFEKENISDKSMEGKTKFLKFWKTEWKECKSSQWEHPPVSLGACGSDWTQNQQRHTMHKTVLNTCITKLQKIII